MPVLAATYAYASWAKKVTKLRKRASYGGKKGRAAKRKLKAMGIMVIKHG